MAVYSPESYGALGDGAHDDGPAFVAMLADMPPKRGTVQLAAATYLTSVGIDFGPNRKITGSDQNAGTTIRASAAGLVMVKIGSSTVLEDVQVDGAGLAKWGVKVTDLANKAHLQRVRAVNCTDAGFVFEGVQNSLCVDLNSQYNRIDYKILNGTGNCVWLNCNSSNANGTDPTSRRVFIGNDTTDPDLAGVVHFGGNTNLTFMGGVYERGGAGLYGFEIADAAGPVALPDAEINAGTIALLRVGPNVGRTIPIHLGRTRFSLSGGNYSVEAAGGVLYWDHPDIWGRTGKSPLGTVHMVGGRLASSNYTGRVQVISGECATYQWGAAIPWSALNAKGGGAVTATPSGRVQVTSVGPTTGGLQYLSGATVSGAWGQAVAPGRHLKLHITLRNISRDKVRVNFSTSTSGVEPGVTLGEGEHEVLLEMSGNESGLTVGSSVAGPPATFEIAECWAEVY